METTIKQDFEYLTIQRLTEILSLTIKKDDDNKVITFLGLLSAYTPEDQMNISFNAPSSTGKSYIPLEISKFFPEEDIIKMGSASPTAFFHEQGIQNKEKNEILVNLERKILIFLDQPNTLLLERIRAILSHDEKEIKSKITDKNQKGGNRTKTVVIRGYPVVLFCTAGLRMDEQEATRFLLLSPEIDDEKFKEAIIQKIFKSSNRDTFFSNIANDKDRLSLIQRIVEIKKANVRDIQIENPDLVFQMFVERIKTYKPRHQREISRIIGLTKSIALLNIGYKKRIGDSIIADKRDIEEAFGLWDKIAESQESGIPPYVLNLFKEVIVPLCKEHSTGITRHMLQIKHKAVFNKNIEDWRLRQEILPMLETAGLIYQENDQVDKRKRLIFLTESGNNSEEGCGVTLSSSPIEGDIDLFGDLDNY